MQTNRTGEPSGAALPRVRTPSESPGPCPRPRPGVLPRIQAEVHPHPSFTQLAYLLTGLVTLARAGRLRLEAVRGDPRSDPAVLRCRVEDDQGRERRVVFDMLDRSNEWDLSGLERADVYFKRNFHRPDLDRLGPRRAGRVEPFGMNFLVRSAASTRWMLRHTLIPELLAWVRGPRPRPKRRVEYQSFFGSPGLAEFEVPPEVSAPPRIAFQTRVWTRGELGPESESLNEERVQMVRALRREFGPRFSGGLVPTPLARERWPAEVSDAPTRRRDHIRWVQGALVAVYTRGLHHSTAFKLPEYLAASRCVVGEPVRNALPRPLVPGEHLLEFRTPTDCVERCAAVLASPELRDRLRRGAWEYWCAEGRPEVRIERCLARVVLAGDARPRAVGP